MWEAIVTALGFAGVDVGINALTQWIKSGQSDSAIASRIESKINEARSKNNRRLTEALERYNLTPMVKGSGALMSYVRKLRAEAKRDYDDVKDSVDSIETKINNVADAAYAYKSVPLIARSKKHIDNLEKEINNVSKEIQESVETKTGAVRR